MMAQPQRNTPGVLPILVIVLAVVAPLSFCSRQVSFDDLREKGGRYYLGADNRPYSGKAVTRFENGRISAEFTLEAGKLHGRMVRWYPDGGKKIEAHYRQGREHGVAAAWFPGGGKTYVCSYRDGVRDGKSISWDEGGRMRSNADFRAGKLDGQWTLWYANGKKQEETGYSADRKHGRCVQWYASGQEKSEAFFDHGENQGTATRWYENGKKESQQSFDQGRPDGQWQWWYPNGKKEIRLQFKDGDYDGAAAGWHENGNKKFYRAFRDGVPEGLWERWHANGVRRTRGQWLNGKLHGKWLEWGSDGGLLEEIIYAQGEKRAMDQWYAAGRKKLEARRQGHGRSWHWRFWRPDGVRVHDTGKPFFRGLYPEFFARRETRSAALGADQRRALASLKKISDYPVYSMDYHGEYGLNRFLAGGGSGCASGRDDFTARQKESFCSTIAARDPRGNVVFGHNWDATKAPFLILRTRPVDGYPSISIVDVLGMSDVSANPALERFRGGESYLRAPYYPLEGMNGRGLAVACMYTPEEMAADPRRATVTMCQIIRLVLDYAADLDEAVALFRTYTINGTQHFLVADISGHSAVLEFKDGELAVIRGREPWQVATNVPVAGVSEDSLRRGCWRYAAASDLLRSKAGRVTWQQAMDILKAISMSETPETILSSVYDLNSGELFLALGRDFGRLLKFRRE
jgi:antitoxin component YwqK of YwqJK toxin-antitoxin module